VERQAEPNLDATEHVEVLLEPLSSVIELARSSGLGGSLHVAALFLALAHLGRVA
jgi:hypothetical protein